MPTERQIQLAFERGVRNITDAARIGELRDALRAGDYAAILSAIDIEPAAFDEMRGLLVEQMALTGSTEVGLMRFRPAVRWNSANPRVESYARNDVGTRIQYITNDMVDSVRWTVGDGYAFGRSIDRIALDLVGRMEGGMRRGGVVGLNLQQSQWIANMRRALRDDPASVVTRFGLRDGRFDNLLLSDRPLTEDQIDNVTRQYANKLLLSRGKMIARTERGLAINAGRFEAWRQAIDKLGLSESAVYKQWVYTNRSREARPSHVMTNGQRVSGLNTPFDVGGVLMQYPHDPSAPARECINCMCEVKIGLRRNG